MALPLTASNTPGTTRTTPRRRSRAKPRPPRPYAVVMAELRGHLIFVYEQVELDGSAAPVASVVEWSNRLASELGVRGVGAPADYRTLYFSVCDVIRSGQAIAPGAVPAAEAA
jgi:hypothetical protein